MTLTLSRRLSTLVEMLTYKRPEGSLTQQEFIKRYLVPLGAAPDKVGNMILRIGTAPILWSSHTDTVHHTPGRQRVRVRHGTLKADPPTECLGADCTTGVWLMREMALTGIEGLYVWHTGEEVGCIGSNYIAEHTPELLEGITAAIAFDRRHVDSIVTHQCGARTASDEFALSLASTLGMSTLEPDDSGVFTDTEVYAGLIPECTNISVGYLYQHSPREQQDLWFVNLLLTKLLAADFSQLTIARLPEAALGITGAAFSTGWSRTSSNWCDGCGISARYTLHGLIEWDGLVICVDCLEENYDVTLDNLENLPSSAAVPMCSYCGDREIADGHATLCGPCQQWINEEDGDGADIDDRPRSRVRAGERPDFDFDFDTGMN